MPRSKSSVTHKKRVKKVIQQAKGYYGKRKNVYSIAKQSVTRSGMFSFAHRRKKKGDFRRLWNVRINAALDKVKDLKIPSFSYSKFIHQLKLANITINRKLLSLMGERDFASFKKLVENLNKNHSK